jgi:hypothetical protein
MESAVLGRCGFIVDFQEDVVDHAEEFVKVIDYLVTVHARLWDPYAPGSAAGVPTTDAVSAMDRLKSEVGMAVALR